MKSTETESRVLADLRPETDREERLIDALKLAERVIPETLCRRLALIVTGEDAPRQSVPVQPKPIDLVDVCRAILTAPIGAARVCRNECQDNPTICPHFHPKKHYKCTRLKGHTGPHSACEGVRHDICTWEEA